MSWHEGERALQEQAGFQKGEALRHVIQEHMPPAAQDFLREQDLAFITTVDGDGRPRVSTLAGPPGFFTVEDERTLELARTAFTDPQALEDLETNAHVGLLAIDFATRRRMRFNGRAERSLDGELVLRATEVYSNCPKYIQKRVHSVGSESERERSPRRVAAKLTREQIGWIENADTFLIGTVHPEAGADASHRGGDPGFVHVEDPSHLTFPDYQGNNMFQTLGNIAVDDRVGLLFLDFESGSTLQLSGRARIVADRARQESFPGALRLIDVEIEEAAETNAAIPGGWLREERSPFNPR